MCVCVCVCVCVCIYHVLAIVNSAAMNIGVHTSSRIRVCIFSKYMPRSGIAGSYGTSMFKMKILLTSQPRLAHLFLPVSALAALASCQALTSPAPRSPGAFAQTLPSAWDAPGRQSLYLFLFVLESTATNIEAGLYQVLN